MGFLDWLRGNPEYYDERYGGDPRFGQPTPGMGSALAGDRLLAIGSALSGSRIGEGMGNLSQGMLAGRQHEQEQLSQIMRAEQEKALQAQQAEKFAMFKEDRERDEMARMEEQARMQQQMEMEAAKAERVREAQAAAGLNPDLGPAMMPMWQSGQRADKAAEAQRMAEIQASMERQQQEQERQQLIAQLQAAGMSPEQIALMTSGLPAGAMNTALGQMGGSEGDVTGRFAYVPQPGNLGANEERKYDRLTGPDIDEAYKAGIVGPGGQLKPGWNAQLEAFREGRSTKSPVLERGPASPDLLKDSDIGATGGKPETLTSAETQLYQTWQEQMPPDQMSGIQYLISQGVNPEKAAELYQKISEDRSYG
jgi:hypothetical protein